MSRPSSSVATASPARIAFEQEHFLRFVGGPIGLNAERALRRFAFDLHIVLAYLIALSACRLVFGTAALAAMVFIESKFIARKVMPPAAATGSTQVNSCSQRRPVVRSAHGHETLIRGLHVAV